MMTRTSLLLLILMCVTGARAQEPQRDQDQTVRLKTDLVTITAAVTDSNGVAVRSLKADDFNVYENGVLQKISHFSSGEEPFTLLLLLDVSGSTADEMMLIKRAARRFLSELRAGDRVGVIVFSGEVELIADFKESRARVEAAIDGAATPEGGGGARFNESTGTSFYDALFLAVEESPLKQIDGRKAIICMSDAVDSSSKTKFLDVAKLVEKSDASVYFLELNTEAVTLNRLLKPKSDPDYADLSQSQVDRYFDAYDADSLDRHRERKVLPHDLLTKINHGLFDLARQQERELAQRTGGRVYPVRSLMDLAGVYKQVADDLRSQYSIGYYSNNDAGGGGWRTIKVEVRGKAKGASVRARSGYWAK